MLKTIKAEFENFDTAELASLKLRKNVKGIRKIKIISPTEKKTSPENDAFYFCLLPTAITTSNYYTQSIRRNSDDSNEEHMIRAAVLCVTCTEECMSAVHSIMASSGGVSISTETYIQ